MVHPHPHPKAMQVLTPSNPEIAKKFGQVRVEDWDDRVAQMTWTEKLVHGQESFPEAHTYKKSLEGVPESTAAIVANDATMEVVRCHSTCTGELILLHNDWL